MAQKKEKRKSGPKLTQPGTKPKKSKKKLKLEAAKKKKLAAIAQPSLPLPKKTTVSNVRKRTASASSDGQPKSRKRVSFPIPADLVQAKAIPEIDVSLAESSAEAKSATPSRSILKQKKVLSPAKKKAEKAAAAAARMEETEPAALNRTLPEFGEEKVKRGKKGLLIKKEDKERMKTMTRPERKAFLRGIKAKRRAYYEVAVAAKTVWERLRSKKTDADVKEKLVDELRALVRGKVRQLMMAHDTVRVVQCLVSLNRAEILAELWEEVQGKETLLLAAKSKYAHHLLLAILRKGSKAQRLELIHAMQGKIPDLVKNIHAAEVIELAYNDFADAALRRRIAFEFYGPGFQLFEVSTYS